MKPILLQSEKTSRSWDPAKSDRLSTVLTSLIENYSSGALTQELRPNTLLELGGEYARFYHAAFRKDEDKRSEWSKARFPEGFQNLVDEINEALSLSGNTIVNSSRQILPYKKLPQDQRLVIERMKEMMSDAEDPITRAEALITLERDFGIQLNSSQISYHFPVDHQPPKVDSDFEAKKSEVLKKILKLKKELDIDLSIESCLKGLVFESFVGTFLTEDWKPEPVERQVAYPVAYKDLHGKSHSLVYTDYQIGDRIFEVKWRNSYENIIDSALPQLSAIERETGKEQKVTVIYRHPCPFMKLARDANLRLSSEVSDMELEQFNSLERRINDVIDYRSIEELLEASPVGEHFIPLLHQLDSQLEGASTDNLKLWVEILDRIGMSEDQIPQKVALFTKMLSEDHEALKTEIPRLFGSPRELTAREARGGQSRQKIVSRASTRASSKLLLEVYNSAFGTTERKLQPEFLDALAKLPDEKISDAALEVFATKESTREARLRDRATRSSMELDGREVISSFERVEARRTEDRIHFADQLDESNKSFLRAHAERCTKAMDATYRPASIPLYRLIPLLKQYGLDPDLTTQEALTLVKNSNKRLNDGAKELESTFRMVVSSFRRLTNDNSRTQDVLNNCLLSDIAGLESSLVLMRDSLHQDPIVQAGMNAAVAIRNKEVRAPAVLRKVVLDMASSIDLDIFEEALELLRHSYRLYVDETQVSRNNARILLDNLADRSYEASAIDSLLSELSIALLGHTAGLYGKLSISSQVQGNTLNFARTDLSLSARNELITQYTTANLSMKLRTFTLNADANTDVVKLQVLPVEWSGCESVYKSTLEDLNEENLLEHLPYLEDTFMIYQGVALECAGYTCRAVVENDLSSSSNIEAGSVLAQMYQMSAPKNGRLLSEDQINEVIQQDPDKLFLGFMNTGVLSLQLSLDFYLRKYQQIVTLAYLDPGVAIEFAHIDNLDVPKEPHNFWDLLRSARELSEKNDRNFEGLMLGKAI